MNLERGHTNSILIPGRPLSDSYTLRFTSVLTKAVIQCVTTNTGSAHGPLLLAFDITTTPEGADEIDLSDGDHLLEVMDTESAIIWTEQVRVD